MVLPTKYPGSPKKLPKSTQEATKNFRAEILTMFLCYFGWNSDTKKTFRNQLTDLQDDLGISKSMINIFTKYRFQIMKINKKKFDGSDITTFRSHKNCNFRPFFTIQSQVTEQTKSLLFNLKLTNHLEGFRRSYIMPGPLGVIPSICFRDPCKI